MPTKKIWSCFNRLPSCVGKLLGIFPCLFFFAGVAPNASAALISADSFSTGVEAGKYTVGQIFGQNPTADLSGFTGAWSATSSTTAQWVAEAGGLSHGLMVGSTSDGRFTTTNTNDLRGIFRDFTSIPASPSYFASFALESSGNKYASLGLRQEGGVVINNPEALGGVSVGFNGANIAVWVNGTTPATLLSNFNVNSTYFALIEIIDSGNTNNDTVNVKLYSAGNTNLSSPDASISVTNQDVTGKFTHLAAIKGTGTGKPLFDEFRFGTTLGDVAAVPEPSTLALAGMSLLLGLGYWTRKRAGR